MQRPLFHFAPHSGWINDPNGLVFHDGLWHLFFQHHPHSLEWGPMHWGHAVSRDLLSWQEWPIALAPDELGAIFSGSAAVGDDGKIVACFTHHGEQGEAQSLAFSDDGGRTFCKFADNPVLKSERRDFRDPKIWKMGESWKMIVAAGQTAQIFSAPDLVSWVLESEFAAPFEDWIWECPDLFPLGNSWVLLGSFIVPDAPHETHYWPGEFDGHTFMSHGGPRKLGFGPDDYAAVSWNNAPDNRRVLIGWMNSWTYANQTPPLEDRSRGAMTLPRELSLREGRLCQNLPPEWAQFRGAAIELPFDAAPLELPASPFELAFSLGDCNAPLEIELRAGAQLWARLQFEPRTRELCLERLELNGQVRRFCAQIAVGDGNLALQLVADNGALTILAQNGELFASALIFVAERPDTLRVRAAPNSKLRGTLFPLSRLCHAEAQTR